MLPAGYRACTRRAAACCRRYLRAIRESPLQGGARVSVGALQVAPAGRRGRRPLRIMRKYLRFAVGADRCVRLHCGAPGRRALRMGGGESAGHRGRRPRRIVGVINVGNGLDRSAWWQQAPRPTGAAQLSCRRGGYYPPTKIYPTQQQKAPQIGEPFANNTVY